MPVLILTLQQILMLNYTKNRESADKISAKKLLSRGLSTNKTHTSTINIKLSQDFSQMDYIKMPSKNISNDKGDYYVDKNKNATLKYGGGSNQKPKYSIKLQSTQHAQKQNLLKKKESYDATVVIKPFQQCNRQMETERCSRGNIKLTERSLSKVNGMKLRTQYIETSAEKYKKQVSTRHTNTNSNQFVRISTAELTGLVDDYKKNLKQVEKLEKQLNFYRRHTQKDASNSVLKALRI